MSIFSSLEIRKSDIINLNKRIIKIKVEANGIKNIL